MDLALQLLNDDYNRLSRLRLHYGDIYKIKQEQTYKAILELREINKEIK
mgnify:CR=1 FL=1